MLKNRSKKSKPPIGTKWGKQQIRISLGLTTLNTCAYALLYLLLGQVAQKFFLNEKPSLTLISGCVLSILAAAFFTGANIWVSTTAAISEEQPIREKLVAQVVEIGPQNRSKESTGKIVDSATNGVERTTIYKNTFLGPLFSAGLTPLIVILLIGFIINWKIAFWLTISLPAIPLVVGGFQMAFRRVSGKSHDARSELAAKYLDAIQGLTTLRILRSAKKVENELAATGEKNRKSIMKLLASNQLILFIIDSVFSILMITLSAILAIRGFQNGDITFGKAISLILLSTLLLQPLDQIGQFFYIGMGGIASQKGIRKILTTPTMLGTNELSYPNNNSPNPIRSNKKTVLSLVNVSFNYHDEPILKNVNLQINPHEQVVLTGASGAGKTTLINIIRGFLKPTTGEVFLNGKLVTNPFLLNSSVAVVSQSTWLFTGTIDYNLTLANPQATVEEKWAALRFANLEEEVNRMPQGLATIVGEKGLAMSGGQAQRIALARAFLADTPLLIFDEPTAHVDLESENYILSAMQKLAKTKTILTVAHSKKLISNADRVINLANHTISELSPTAVKEFTNSSLTTNSQTR